MSVSKTIKMIRKKSELNQSAFAKALKVTRATASHWERNTREPNLKNCKQIILFARKFDIEISIYDLKEGLKYDKKQKKQINKV